MSSMSVHALTALYPSNERVFSDFSCFFCFYRTLLPNCHLQADASLIRFFRFYVFFAVTVSAETRTMEAVFRLIELSCSSLCTYSERENATKREKADRLRA